MIIFLFKDFFLILLGILHMQFLKNYMHGDNIEVEVTKYFG